MIEVQNLNLKSKTQSILTDINFSLPYHQSLGISGRSGSGKTLLLKSLIRLLDSSLHLQAKKLSILSTDILYLPQKSLPKLRSEISLVFQDVYSSFYPLMDIGCYFNLVTKTHSSLNSKLRRERAFYFFERLGLKNPNLIWHSYIYQLSGGMAKRVQLALALSCGAKYLLCDEITSSIDENNKEKMFEILLGLKNEVGLIFVTHDLDLLQTLCDEIIILEEGKIIELQARDSFFTNPISSYAKEMLEFKQ